MKRRGQRINLSNCAGRSLAVRQPLQVMVAELTSFHRILRHQKQQKRLASHAKMEVELWGNLNKANRTISDRLVAKPSDASKLCIAKQLQAVLPWQ